jgi:hypothetical protein
MPRALPRSLRRFINRKFLPLYFVAGLGAVLLIIFLIFKKQILAFLDAFAVQIREMGIVYVHQLSL